MTYQLYYRLSKPSFRYYSLSANLDKIRLLTPLEKYISINGQVFTFLNQSSPFISWNDSSKGMLWAYNLNYMDWLLQEDMTFEEGAKWIDRFISEIPVNKVGLDPYPTALRCLNWIKFISIHFDEIDQDRLKVWNDSLFSQYCHLDKNLEFHLMGNHLLEDAYSLFVGSIYFSDEKLYRKSAKLLRRQLTEQILPDGAHFEQSPMYHCILLDRLLDCYNFSINNLRFEGQNDMNDHIAAVAVRMLGHLDAILYEDGSYPLFNDSALKIAPVPGQIFSYASSLGLVWQRCPMKEVGYRVLRNGGMAAFIDVGNVTAGYQPGHTHADTFTYELRIGGCPFVVDTGISTYEKNSRRYLERSTSAHNTVTVSDTDSSEVWSGFRLGKRAQVQVLTDNISKIEAVHDGYGKNRKHSRIFEISDDSFCISDVVTSSVPSKNHIHLASDVKILSVNDNAVITDRGEIFFSGADRVEVDDCLVSNEYNTLLPSKVIVVYFMGSMSYTIKTSKV